MATSWKHHGNDVCNPTLSRTRTPNGLCCLDPAGETCATDRGHMVDLDQTKSPSDLCLISVRARFTSVGALEGRKTAKAVPRAVFDGRKSAKAGRRATDGERCLGNRMLRRDKRSKSFFPKVWRTAPAAAVHSNAMLLLLKRARAGSKQASKWPCQRDKCGSIGA